MCFCYLKMATSLAWLRSSGLLMHLQAVWRNFENVLLRLCGGTICERETSVLSAENPASVVVKSRFTAEGWECIIRLFKEVFGCCAEGMWAVTELLWCPALPQLLTTASLAQLRRAAQLWTQRTAIVCSTSAYVWWRYCQSLLVFTLGFPAGKSRS